MCPKQKSITTVRAFSLIEVMIAVTVLSLAFLAGFSLLQFNRLQSRKAQDQAIMLDFTQHYLEIARSRTYDQIAAGSAINPLFDGVSKFDSTNAINIRFVNSSNWNDLSTSNFLMFHPDLAWFGNRNPEYQCQILTETSFSAAQRCKVIRMTTRWHPPLRPSNWQTLAAETAVYPDYH